jgi:hypothetical protein
MDLELVIRLVVLIGLLSVFIDNRMCLININTFFFIQFEICGRFDFHFEAVLTWVRFD